VQFLPFQVPDLLPTIPLGDAASEVLTITLSLAGGKNLLLAGCTLQPMILKICQSIRLHCINQQFNIIWIDSSQFNRSEIPRNYEVIVIVGAIVMTQELHMWLILTSPEFKFQR
jgi:hypothetical protein